MDPQSRLLILTDLDGSLLDADTYGYEAARPALKSLRDRGIPLIFCSSKTFAEVEPIRHEMENTVPFIVEMVVQFIFLKVIFLRCRRIV